MHDASARGEPRRPRPDHPRPRNPAWRLRAIRDRRGPRSNVHRGL